MTRLHLRIRLADAARGLFLWGMAFSLLASQGRCVEGQLITVISNGPTSQRINVVLLAEAYQQSERAKFAVDSQRVANGLLNSAPVSAYRSFYNVFGIFVASVDSGADKPLSGVFRDTYFNSTYNSYGIQRLLTIPPNDRNGRMADGEGKVMDLLRALVPDYDLAAVVVNDAEYGGSGGPILVVSTEASSAEIAAHEMGHSFAGLGDEYSEPYPGYPSTEEPNTTRQTQRALLKWNRWVLPTTPLPTPASNMFQSVVGLFEGAHYHQTGWYRPKLSCKMRILGNPFCEVCSQALVLSLFDRIGTIESATPPHHSPVAVPFFGSTLFRLNPVALPSDVVRTEWTLNGVSLAPSNPVELELAGSALSGGENLLIVTLAIDSRLVRHDPDFRARQTLTWSLTRDTQTAPSLGVRRVAGGLELVWTALAEGFVPETTTHLGGEDWLPVEKAPDLDGVSFRLSLPASESRAYFRLRPP